MYYKIVYIILLYITLLLPGSLQAQKPSKAAALCEKAKTAVNAHDFNKAKNLLMQARVKDPQFPDTYILLGDLYNFTLKSDSAEACYNRAIDLIGNPDPLLYYIAATEGAKCGHYETALKNYETFMQRGLQYPAERHRATLPLHRQHQRCALVVLHQRRQDLLLPHL